MQPVQLRYKLLEAMNACVARLSRVFSMEAAGVEPASKDNAT